MTACLSRRAFDLYPPHSGSRASGQAPLASGLSHTDIAAARAMPLRSRLSAWFAQSPARVAELGGRGGLQLERCPPVALVVIPATARWAGGLAASTTGGLEGWMSQRSSVLQSASMRISASGVASGEGGRTEELQEE